LKRRGFVIVSDYDGFQADLVLEREKPLSANSLAT